MVRQPEYGARDVNRLFYKAEGRRIGLLNQSFFQDVGLTADENRVLVWLCGLDDFTIDNVVSAFRKAVLQWEG